MWTVSEKRCVQLQNKGGYYNTNTNFVQYLQLPSRYHTEYLDYSLDISAFLQDSADRIQLVQAEAENMYLSWLSYGQSCILFGLHGGHAPITGTVYCYFNTMGGRSFEITLTQPVLLGRFVSPDPPPNIDIPNLVQFPNTQPLSSSDEAFFFFG